MREGVRFFIAGKLLLTRHLPQFPTELLTIFMAKSNYPRDMKKTLLTALCGAFITLSLHAQTYVLDKTIDLPGNAGYDYLSIDKVNHRLYVSHGTTVNVIDLQTEKQVGIIADMKGVHGIAIDNKANRGFISDGRANAVVAFDLKTLKTIATIPVDAKGPDAIMYDPFSDRVFSFNGESNNSSVVDPNTLKQVGRVDLGGGPEFAVADGKGLIYNNLEDKSSLNIINSKTLKVIKLSVSAMRRPYGFSA
jgi:DNA-binding beta-propeller fold protein YncE